MPLFHALLRNTRRRIYSLTVTPYIALMRVDPVKDGFKGHPFYRHLNRQETRPGLNTSPSYKKSSTLSSSNRLSASKDPSFFFLTLIPPSTASRSSSHRSESLRSMHSGYPRPTPASTSPLLLHWISHWFDFKRRREMSEREREKKLNQMKTGPK